MSATVTLKSRLENALRYIDDNFDVSNGSICHFYTGQSLPWDDEYSPDVSSSSYKQMRDAAFQRIFMKQIVLDDVTTGIKKFVWEANTVYSRADTNVGYCDYRNWVGAESPFYVVNSEGNVYKCISNNYGGDSTVEPTGTSSTYIHLGDGYVWKFMLDLSTAIEEKFVSESFFPIPYDTEKSFNQLAVESAAVDGDIAYIHVDDGGDEYTGVPVIEVRGDGTGCSATAIMSGESIDYIQIAAAGSGYTWADVYIFGNGNGASCSAMVSPVGGHGADAVTELGAYYVMVSKEIIGNEDGLAPITGTYRNVGIVKDTLDTSAAAITDEKLNTLSTINISDTNGVFLSGELVIGTDSLSQGRCYYDPATGDPKDITMYMMEGDFTDGEIIYGQDSDANGVYSEADSTLTTVDITSGEVLYKENIIFITRREIQIEKFVFTIEF